MEKIMNTRSLVLIFRNVISYDTVPTLMKDKFTLFTIHKVRNNDVSSLQNKVKAFERELF